MNQLHHRLDREASPAGLGRHSDDPPSAVRATTPGAKLRSGHSSPRFALTEGVTMPTSRKSLYDLAALRFAPILDLEVKAGRDGAIAGYASTFDGKPDRVGDVVAAGAFRRTLAEHKAEGTAPAMLWSHRIDEPIGKWLDIREDRTGLFVSGQVNLKTERGRAAFEHVAAGDVEGFSIGYRAPDPQELDHPRSAGAPDQRGRPSALRGPGHSHRHRAP
jgi:HK97 family phage prohead protease